MSEHQAPAPGWWWYDTGPRGRVIPDVVLVEEYDGVLYADVGTGQKPVKPGPSWLGPVAPYQPTTLASPAKERAAVSRDG